MVLDYPGGPRVRGDHRILMRAAGRESESGERSEDTALLALRKGEGARSQGMPAALRSWKRQGNGFSRRASRKTPSLDFPRRPFHTSDL